MPAHAVRDAEEAVSDNHGVLVVLADPADVRAPRDPEDFRRFSRLPVPFGSPAAVLFTGSGVLGFDALHPVDNFSLQVKLVHIIPLPLKL